MLLGNLWTRIGDLLQSNPITAVSLIAGAIALATTPMAFAVLGRTRWFDARRGRTLQRPAFWSVVCSMILVMGVPAIFLALLDKSEYFDKDRYEFDPNRTITPVDQGRQYEARDLLASVHKLDEGVRKEQERLALTRKELVEAVKKLDVAMISLRESARQAPVVVDPLNEVLEKLGGIRKAVGVDGPQQLVNLKADPAAMAAAGASVPGVAPVASVPPPAAPVTNGLPPAEAQAIVAATPAPQKVLAAMIPLTDIPPGWVVAKLPGKTPPQYVETFNADNLFEKIDGRAESFIQYGVKGMACVSYHPKGNEEDEVQLFIFEMGDPLRAQGKYDAEKPDEDAKEVSIGGGAYTAAGSVFVRSAQYYTIVNVAQDSPKQTEFAQAIARRVADQQKPAAGQTGPTADDIFKLLPAEPKRSGTKFVAEDVFGYSFLSNVFLADYSSGKVSFQGFLRPCESPQAALALFEQYVKSVEKDGAKITPVADSPAEKMVVSSNTDLISVVFVKGNTLAGVDGASDPKEAEAFAREFAKNLPSKVPMIATEKKTPAEPEPEAADK